jgi:hypothetical protein
MVKYVTFIAFAFITIASCEKAVGYFCEGDQLSSKREGNLPGIAIGLLRSEKEKGNEK